MNPVILSMVSIDFFVNSALGTISPFFAIFITGQIAGGSATVAGFASATYWVVKSLFQLPIARWLDKTDGERDEFWAFFGGYLTTALVPIVYFFSREPWHIYFAQGLFGFAMAWAVPAWYSIFTRHIDKFRIGLEWSLYSVISIGISASLASALGGLIIDRFGFRSIFLMASVLIFTSTFFIFGIKKYIYRKRRPLLKLIPEHKTSSGKMH